MEVLTDRVMKTPGWEEAVVFRQELDEARRFARYGEPGKHWPFHRRRIYPEQHRFRSGTSGDYEVLHEFTLLYTEDQQLYAVIAILGVEYAINLANPSIESYQAWLGRNGDASPLYPAGAA